MIEILKPIALYFITGGIGWFAGRYHLDTSQQQQITSDVMGAAGVAVTAAAGALVHWRALVSPPPITK
jgi:hypothetical protein